MVHYKDKYEKAWAYVAHIFSGTELTKKDFINWWEATGEFDNRGRRKGNVCMMPIDFDKPRSISNIQLMEISAARKLIAKRRGM